MTNEKETPATPPAATHDRVGMFVGVGGVLIAVISLVVAVQANAASDAANLTKLEGRVDDLETLKIEDQLSGLRNEGQQLANLVSTNEHQTQANEGLIGALAEELDALSFPVGVVVAWMHEELPASDNWRICNGDSIAALGLTPDEDRKLRGVLVRRDKLPDLRGYFLRGAGESPGAPADLISRSGDKGVGSTQDDAVAAAWRAATGLGRSGAGDISASGATVCGSRPRSDASRAVGALGS